jgi:outer membrane scaffolding protein for murein synthesis (MipA/OmpV family)
MPGLGPQLELGPRARITLARPTPASRVRLDLPLRRVFEVRGGLHQRGWVADPRLVWETSDEARRWGFYADVGATFGDATHNRHFYEVAPQYATPERPAYVARAGLVSTRVGASLWWRMNDTTRLYAFAREESYAHSANRASPLFEATSGLSVGLGLSWTLARSSEPAP